MWHGAYLAVTLLVLGACGRPARVHPWPMFRGDPSHGGDREALPTPAWRIAWQVELGARVDASPLVLDRGVLVVTRTGTAVRLDQATGAVRARAALGGDVWATPAAVGDVVVLGVRRGRAGELIGLDLDDLSVRWRRAVARGGFGAATVIDGLVWLCHGAALIAVAPRDGAERARIALGDRCFGAPAPVDGAVVVATRDGLVRAFADGRERWRAVTSPGADNDTAPVIADRLVLVGSNDTWAHALAVGGAPRWRAGGTAWVVTAPLVAGDTVVLGDDDGWVRAVGLADGAPRWQRQVGADVASSPVRVGTMIVHGAHDRFVHGWRARDGTPQPAIDAGARVFASPAVTADGGVVIATHGGRVLLIR